MSARVLIVDDEPLLRAALERVLKTRGYEVFTAGDARSAYELLHGVEIDAILLDLHLPLVGGDTFYLSIVRRWPALTGRVAFMTGEVGPDRSHWPELLQRCAILLKPFSLEHLQATLRVLTQPEGGTRVENHR